MAEERIILVIQNLIFINLSGHLTGNQKINLQSRSYLTFRFDLQTSDPERRQGQQVNR